MNDIVKQIIEKTKHIKEKFVVMYSSSGNYFIKPKMANELNEVGIKTEDFDKGKVVFFGDRSEDDLTHGEMDRFMVKDESENHFVYIIRYYEVPRRRK
jgi:hypothetical protein